MRDYIRVLTKINETPWLMTPEGLAVVMSVFNEHLQGTVSKEQLQARLEIAGAHGSDSIKGQVGGVGILPVYGPIFGKANMMTELSGATSLEAFRKDLSAMLADDSIGSVILDIDSPGGTSEMVAEAGDEIFAGKDIKPIYAISNNMMGSAAYWLGSQATSLYTTPSGSVGSVGAYTVHTDQSGADAKDGVRYTIISAGPYKTEGNPHEALSAEGVAYRQELINELYGEFVDAVGRGRNISSDVVKESYGGGRMIPAKRALEAKMVDGIMEFDALLHSASESNQRIPTRVPVAIGNAHSVTATFDRALGAYVVPAQLEHAPEEHAEPGISDPPPPRTDQDENKAAQQGWRRTNVEYERGTDGAPKANGGNMDLEALMALFGVKTEEELSAAITAMHSEASSLRDAVNVKSEQLRFKEQFPNLYDEHVANVEKGLKADAKDFLASVSTFKKPQGEGFVDTPNGLSALAADTITETYMAFAKGEGNLEMFTKAITAITQGGVVEYGERGTSTAAEVVEVDMNTPQGIAGAKQRFADEVAKIQTEDNLDYNTAISVAAEKFPELAQAWRMALPA